MNTKSRTDGRPLDEADAKPIKFEDLTEDAFDQQERMLYDSAVEAEREAQVNYEFYMDNSR